MIRRALARGLSSFASWALSKNPPGPYRGEDDTRWAYTIVVDGEKYLTRILSPRLFGCRVYLHHFHRPDVGRHLHNHPWKWAASLLLSGSYEEDRLDEATASATKTFRHLGVLTEDELLSEHKHVHRANFIADTDYHRVTRLHGDVWTLFVVGPENKEWGFFVDGEHVPWKKHLGVG